MLSRVLKSSFKKQFRFQSTTSPSSTFPIPKCINELYQNPPASNTPVKIQGWVSAARISKNVAFVDIVDGTSHEDVKCIVRPPSLLPEKMNTGASISLSGTWTEGKGKQKYEVQVNESSQLEILGEVQDLYPLQKKTHTAQFLRTIPEFRWRMKHLSALLRFRSYVEACLVEFYNEHSFTKTHPPLITSSDCEGAGELFKIESNSLINTKDQFFGKDAYLTVSTQLHLEVMCAALSRVWTLTPCFRAEESDTNRHLSEFWMLEAEIAFVDRVSQLTKFSELMIKYVVRKLINNAKNSGSNLTSTVPKELVDQMVNRWNMLLAKDDWDSITYTKAIEILKDAYDNKAANFKYEPVWGKSLKSEHEKWLAGEYFKSPVFVTDYPIEEKPFYMKINSDESTPTKTVGCYDLLVPDIGELIGGSLREHDLKKLEAEIKRRGMSVDALGWYLALRENGSVPHGGFGMGFERLLQYLSCTENIRDVIPFPRVVNSCPC